MSILIKEVPQKWTFSGHDSFQCRNLWLKKGYDFLEEKKDFNGEDAVIHLGVGKNMVSSIRYWLKAFNIVGQDNRLTEFGDFCFGKNGYDPYLEDDATLWLLHYQLVKTGFASIYQLIFNKLRKERVEFTKDSFLRYIDRNPDIPTQNQNTLEKDFGVFLKTYLNEDTKDSESLISYLLTDLNLLESFKNGTESYYVIENLDRESLPEEVVLYAILDKGGFESSINFKTLENGENSICDIFALNKQGLLTKVQALCEKYDFLVFSDQAGVKELQFKSKPDQPLRILSDYYEL